MEKKLFNVLKPLVADKGLSKEEIEGLAKIYAKNLTETSTDEEINNVANGIIPIADMMQKTGNRLATSVETKYKGYVDPATLEKYNEWLKEQGKPIVPPTPAPPAQPTLTAEDISKMIQESIAASLRPMQEQQEKARLSSLLSAHEKVKSIPQAFRSRYTLDKEEDLESVASQMESDYAELKQQLIRDGVFQKAPEKANENIDDDIQALQDMVTAAQKQ